MSKYPRDFKRIPEEDELRRKRQEVTEKRRVDLKTARLKKRRYEPYNNFGLLEQLPKLAKDIYSSDINQQLEATTGIRRILSLHPSPPCQQVIDSGVVPRLVQFLSIDNTKLQFEAAWALTNVASDTIEHTESVIAAGAIKPFVNLLTSERSPETLKDQAVWALSNIAADSVTNRDLVFTAGALPPMLLLIHPSTTKSLLRNVAWALSNLFRGNTQAAREHIIAALPYLTNLIRSADEEILNSVCKSCAHIADDRTAGGVNVESLIQTGMASRIVELLLHSCISIRESALLAVGFIVMNKSQIKKMLELPLLLPHLLVLFTQRTRSIRRNVCWAVANIMSGTPAEIQAVINAKFIPLLLRAVGDVENDIQVDAAWAISRMTLTNRDEQLQYLVNTHAIPSLCGVFDYGDAKLVKLALQSLTNLLRFGSRQSAQTAQTTGSGGGGGGVTTPHNKCAELVEACLGLDQLELLQQHSDPDLCQRVKWVLNQFDPPNEQDGAAWRSLFLT